MDGFGSSSVLMFTTAGPTCLTIWEKPLESTTGEGITRGLASDESILACSLPLTFRVRTEPGEDANREGREESKRRGEAVSANAIEQCLGSVIRCVHYSVVTSLLCVAVRRTVCAA